MKPGRIMPSAEIFQPMEYFETLSKSPAMLLDHVYMRAEKMAQENRMPIQQFREWFDAMTELAGKTYLVAFYGKSVYGDKDELPSDLDVIFFMLDEKPFASDKRVWGLLRYPGRPRFVHAMEVWQNENPMDNLSGWKRFCVAGTLLTIPSVHPDVRAAVEKARKDLLDNNFFVGGFGDILTYAVWKVLEGKEYEYIEPGNRGLLERNFFVARVECDGSAVPPVQFKKDVRRELTGKFNLSEMRILARAAARRIKIKASRRDEIAERFVSNMRPMVQR